VNRLIALLLVALPLPALAGQCNHWSAGMQEDEGGPVMMADICTKTAGGTATLLLSCGEPGKLSARLLFDDTTAYSPPDPEFKTKLEVAADEVTAALPAHFEEMDGAMVVDIERTSPLGEALVSKSALAIRDLGGKVTAVRFTLAGSKAALAKLTATCGQN
jgi:hypothetical protein